jgi:hypothetical protein
MSDRKAPPSGLPERASVDRFEEDLAVLSVDGGQQTIERRLLPEDAREGDVIDFVRGVVDREATEAIRARQRALKGTPKIGSFDLD